MTKYLKIAKEAAEVAANIAMRYFGKNPKVELKADRSPVTIADKKAEQAIIETISAKFPDHAFLGEETGRSESHSDYLWIIDPIDGTKNFIDGIPLWGNLIALMHKGEVVVGVSNMPAVGEMLWAAKGKGAYLNGKRVRVSSRHSLNDCRISYGSLYAFKKAGKYRRVLSLIDACKRQRCFGDCWPFHLLACGKLDLVVECGINVYDVAPFDIIIREAGGEVSDIEGRRLNLKTSSIVATNGRLHSVSLLNLT